MSSSVRNSNVEIQAWQATRPRGVWRTFRRWLIDRTDGGSAARLEATLMVFSEELRALRQNSTGGESLCPHWGEHAARLLQNGQEALDNGNTELGWRCFSAARRFTFHSLEAAKLNREAQGILNEAAEKLNGGWRKQTIVDLLTDSTPGLLREDLQPDTVIRAARVLDEHHENIHRKRAIITERLAILAFVSTLVLGLWVWISPTVGALTNVGADSRNELRTFWFTVLLAGLMGALISGFTESIKQDGRKKLRVPDELINSIITYARLALASLSAVAVILFLGSGLISFAGEISHELALVVALLSGFSERLLARAARPLLEEPADKGMADK